VFNKNKKQTRCTYTLCVTAWRL